MTKKFTPGPWEQSHRRCSDGGFRTQVYDASGSTIATLDWHVMDKLAETLTTDRAENARLIVAAPDLYTIVERFRRYHDGVARSDSAEQVQTCLCSVCVDAELVLAKARGDL